MSKKKKLDRPLYYEPKTDYPRLSFTVTKTGERWGAPILCVPTQDFHGYTFTIDLTRFGISGVAHIFLDIGDEIDEQAT